MDILCEIILNIHYEIFTQKDSSKRTKLMINNPILSNSVNCNIKNKDNLKDNLKYNLNNNLKLFITEILLNAVKSSGEINIEYFKRIVFEYALHFVTKLYAIGN